jgi:hypothetical protein
MTTVILSIPHADPSRMLEDERLETIRNLMVAGCYGSLEVPVGVDRDPIASVLDHVTATGGRVTVVQDNPPWNSAISALQDGACDALRLVAPTDLIDLDAGLGRLLPCLDDQAVVLVIALGKPLGAFVLASARIPLTGLVEGARLDDLPPTILELAGHAAPATMPGRSLVSGLAESAVDEDEEELVRERLRGLGYIA